MHFDDKTHSARFTRNNEANAHQIIQVILEKAEGLGLETEGLASLERKIKEALKLLDEEIQHKAKEI